VIVDPKSVTVELLTLEVERVAERLETMPAAKANDDVCSLVQDRAARIVALTPDPRRPADWHLPTLGPTALAAQLRLVVRDYLGMRTAASEDAAVAEILIDLRRSLP
jgi:hypothetical protein